MADPRCLAPRCAGCSRMNDAIHWTSDDEFVVDGVSFACIGLPRPDTVSTADRFYIIKSPRLVETYERVIEKVVPENIFEAGIWYGGSTAFIAQLARPRKLVAIELTERECMPLKTFIARHDLSTTVV